MGYVIKFHLLIMKFIKSATLNYSQFGSQQISVLQQRWLGMGYGSIMEEAQQKS